MGLLWHSYARGLFEKPNIAFLADYIETIRWAAHEPELIADNREEITL